MKILSAAAAAGAGALFSRRDLTSEELASFLLSSFSFETEFPVVGTILCEGQNITTLSLDISEDVVVDGLEKRTIGFEASGIDWRCVNPDTLDIILAGNAAVNFDFDLTSLDFDRVIPNGATAFTKAQCVAGIDAGSLGPDTTTSAQTDAAIASILCDELVGPMNEILALVANNALTQMGLAAAIIDIADDVTTAANQAESLLLQTATGFELFEQSKFEELQQITVDNFLASPLVVDVLAIVNDILAAFTGEGGDTDEIFNQINEALGLILGIEDLDIPDVILQVAVSQIIGIAGGTTTIPSALVSIAGVTAPFVPELQAFIDNQFQDGLPVAAEVLDFVDILETMVEPWNTTGVLVLTSLQLGGVPIASVGSNLDPDLAILFGQTVNQLLGAGEISIVVVDGVQILTFGDLFVVIQTMLPSLIFNGTGVGSGAGLTVGALANITSALGLEQLTILLSQLPEDLLASNITSNLLAVQVIGVFGEESVVGIIVGLPLTTFFEPIDFQFITVDIIIGIYLSIVQGVAGDIQEMISQGITISVTDTLQDHYSALFNMLLTFVEDENLSLLLSGIVITNSLAPLSSVLVFGVENLTTISPTSIFIHTPIEIIKVDTRFVGISSIVLPGIQGGFEIILTSSADYFGAPDELVIPVSGELSLQKLITLALNYEQLEKFGFAKVETGPDIINVATDYIACASSSVAVSLFGTAGGASFDASSITSVFLTGFFEDLVNQAIELYQPALTTLVEGSILQNAQSKAFMSSTSGLAACEANAIEEEDDDDDDGDDVDDDGGLLGDVPVAAVVPAVIGGAALIASVFYFVFAAGAPAVAAGAAGAAAAGGASGKPYPAKPGFEDPSVVVDEKAAEKRV